MESLRLRLLALFVVLIAISSCVFYLLMRQQKFNIVTNYEAYHLDAESRVLANYWNYLGGCDAYDPESGPMIDFDLGFSDMGVKAYAIFCPDKPPYEVGAFPKSAYESDASRTYIEANRDEKWILNNHQTNFGHIYGVSLSGQSWEAIGLITHIGIIITLLIFLICLVVLYYAIDFVFRPIRKMNEVSSANVTKLGKLRLPIELQPIKNTVLSFFEKQRGLEIANQRLLLNEREFTANAAHELLTPLAAMKTEIQLQKQMGKGSAPHKRWLIALEERLNRAVKTVDQLVIIARLNPRLNKTDTTKSTRINLVELLQDLVLDFKNKLDANDLTVKVTADKENFVFGSPVTIHILLRNLLENAIKYSPKGGNIGILLSSTNSTTTFSVQNNCAPLPEYLGENIFNRFVRGPSDNVSGSGLGLSITQLIAEAHNTKIDMNLDETRTNIEFSVTFPYQA